MDLGWCKAMQEKIDAFEHNGTRTLADLPLCKRAINSGWIYKIKYTCICVVERLKGRLVVHYNKQVIGIYYNETFSLVVKKGISFVSCCCCAQLETPPDGCS